MSLFTGEPRSAGVVAIRESVLVRLSKPAFERLIATQPSASAALTRQLIHRFVKEDKAVQLVRPVTMGLLPVSPGVDIAAFCARLAAPLARLGRVRVVDAAAVEAALQPQGLSSRDADPALDRRVALVLEEIEAASDFVLLVGEDRPDAVDAALRAPQRRVAAGGRRRPGARIACHRACPAARSGLERGSQRDPGAAARRRLGPARAHRQLAGAATAG